MNGVEGPKRDGEGLGCAGENSSRGLDDRDRLDDAIYRLTPASDLGLLNPLENAQAIECPKTFHLYQRAGNPAFDGSPLAERPWLPEYDAQDDGGVEIGNHRSPRSCARSLRTSVLRPR